MTDAGIDDHHVFPAAFLEKEKGIKPARLRDCVLNRTLVDRTTNQMISDWAPSEYLAKIRNTEGFPFSTVLSSHILPSDENSALLQDNYEDFLVWRQKELWQRIKDATGASFAADLETDESELE